MYISAPMITIQAFTDFSRLNRAFDGSLRYVQGRAVVFAAPFNRPPIEVVEVECTPCINPFDGVGVADENLIGVKLAGSLGRYRHKCR